ncbi:MAG TPA: S1/P1 nuclease [Polyangiales bacterium]|nr:S1/P1 nuclease [Polyangiales bacterium]
MTALLLHGMVAAPAQAWGGAGHRIVAALAERWLSDPSRASVARLLAGESLASIANWADAYREQCANTGPWHYVNIPLAATHYDEARLCPAEPSCVVRAIEQARDVLADATQSDADRAFALRLLVHFVGDLHQPLHSGDRKDRGGNDQFVRFEGKLQTLHAFWDHELIRWSGRSEPDYVVQLEQSMRPALRESLQRGEVFEWALEAKRAARLAYRGIPEARSEERAVPLRAQYAQNMLPVADRQLSRAAARLAKLLNDAFAQSGSGAEAQLAGLRACTGPRPRR